MNEPAGRPSTTTGVILVTAGTLILVALVAFITIAISFRQSFTSTLPPIGDMIEGMTMLSPIIVIALLLIGYGRHLLRRQ
jgi:heme/copper-type cytochrome/quinol oxidase subunit 2